MWRSTNVSFLASLLHFTAFSGKFLWTEFWYCGWQVDIKANRCY